MSKDASNPRDWELVQVKLETGDLPKESDLLLFLMTETVKLLKLLEMFQVLMLLMLVLLIFLNLHLVLMLVD